MENFKYDDKFYANLSQLACDYEDILYECDPHFVFKLELEDGTTDSIEAHELKEHF